MASRRVAAEALQPKKAGQPCRQGKSSSTASAGREMGSNRQTLRLLQPEGKDETPIVSCKSYRRRCAEAAKRQYIDAMVREAAENIGQKHQQGICYISI